MRDFAQLVNEETRMAMRADDHRNGLEEEEKGKTSRFDFDGFDRSNIHARLPSVVVVRATSLVPVRRFEAG